MRQNNVFLYLSLIFFTLHGDLQIQPFFPERKKKLDSTHFSWLSNTSLYTHTTFSLPTYPLMGTQANFMTVGHCEWCYNECDCAAVS